MPAPFAMTQALFSIAALLVAAGLLYTGNGLQSTLLAVRGGQEGFSPLIIGLVMSAYYLGFILGCRITSIFVANVGHIRVFTALASIASAAALAHALFVDPIFWMVLRVITGFCFAGVAMVAESWINERANNANRGKVLAVYRIVDLSALTVGQLLLLVASPDGFVLFGVVSILVSIALVPVALTRVSAPLPITATRLDLPRLFTVSPLAAIGCTLTGLGNTAFWALTPVFVQQGGLGTQAVASVMAVSVVAGALTQWPLGMLSDRIDRRWTILLGAAGTVAGSLFFVGMAEAPTYYNAAAALFGAFALPLFGLCVAHANDQADPDSYVAINGGLLLLYGCGAVAGPLVASAAMGLAGSAGLFLFIAGVNGVLVVVGLVRMLVHAPVPVEDREDFFAVTPTVTSPVAFEMDPRAPEEAEEEEQAANDEAPPRPLERAADQALAS